MNIKLKFSSLALVYLPLVSFGQVDNLSSMNFFENDPTDLVEDFEIDADGCMVNYTDQLVNSVIYAAERISLACERQNIAMKENGYERCPTNSCMSTHEIGGLQAPSMEIKLSNSSGSSSFGYSSYSRTSSTSSRNTTNIFVTVTLKMNLAKDPDKILCVNPLSPASIDKVLGEVINLNSTTNACS